MRFCPVDLERLLARRDALRAQSEELPSTVTCFRADYQEKAVLNDLEAKIKRIDKRPRGD